MNALARHPRLDDLLADLESGRPPDAHFETCTDCSRARQGVARIVSLLGEARHRPPAGWQAAVLAHPDPGRATPASPPRARRRWPLAAAALAVAGLVLLVGRGRQPDPYLAAKGASLTIVRRQGTGAHIVGAGEAVRAGDELRFIVGGPALDEYPFLVLGSVDGTGEFSPFYPFERTGRSLLRPRPGEPLPGGIILDDAPGAERIVTVLSARRLTVEEVARAARSAVASGHEAFDRVGAVPVRVTWRTLEKVGPASTGPVKR
jgi:hypothetical protein